MDSYDSSSDDSSFFDYSSDDSSFFDYSSSSSFDSFSTSSFDFHPAFFNSFSSSPSAPRWMHDVFISFGGDEIGKSFISHLVAALTNARIETYSDSYHLLRGTDLGPKLARVIEESRVSIIIFSKYYTRSRRCLNELEKIMECRTTRDQFVFPVFYDVDPSTVRHQSGDFGQSLEFVAKGEEFWKLSKWRSALTQAASLSGWVFKSSR